MRRKRKDDARSSITFINSYSELVDAQARRHARRHASYWGHKRSRVGGTPALPRSCSGSATPLGPENSEVLQPDGFQGSTPGSETSLMAQNAHHIPAGNLYFGAAFDAFQCLPQLPTTCKESPDLHSVRMIMQEFFGQDFIRDTLLRDSEFCRNRYAGCLLLCYAYYVAITGRRCYAPLMALKCEVIGRVNQAVNDPKSIATLDTMLAVMALGTPIVCEMTNSPSKYPQSPTTASSGSQSTLSSPESTSSLDTDGSATEYHLHYQAVSTLLRMQPDPAYLTTTDGRFVFLVKVVSSAHRMLTMIPHLDTEAWVLLFQKFERYSTDSVPDVSLNSPLFVSSQSRIQRTRPRMNRAHLRCLELAQSVRTWFTHYKRSRTGILSNLGRVRNALERTLAVADEELDDPADSSHEGSAMYEACVIATRLMMESADRGCSLSDAVPFVSRAAQLPEILRKTDLLHLWGELRGLLYWVTLVNHVVTSEGQASGQTQGRMVSTLILAHFTQLISASETRFPLVAALTPIKELLQWPQ